MLTACATVPGDFPYKEEPPKAYGTPTGEILKDIRSFESRSHYSCCI